MNAENAPTDECVDGWMHQWVNRSYVQGGGSEEDRGGRALEGGTEREREREIERKREKRKQTKEIKGNTSIRPQLLGKRAGQ